VKSNKKIYTVLGVAILLYAAIVLGTPPDPEVLQRYNISVIQAKMINLTIIVPLALIWIVAVYGYVVFKDYSRLIRKSKDGNAFLAISNGLGLLAAGLPLASIISLLTNIVVDKKPNLMPVTTVFNHYLSISIAIVAFWFIYQGAQKLQTLTKAKPHGMQWSLLLGSFVALALTYVYLVLSNPARNHPGLLSGGRTIFYLPDWLIVTTIIAPYLYVWYVGLVSGFYINFYQQKVGGIIYKQAFRYLAIGIVSVIGGSILRQYLTAASNLLADLRLAPLLLLVYTLLIAIAIGYVLIGIGARKLKHIEEV
jgi:hypothetical protein